MLNSLEYERECHSRFHHHFSVTTPIRAAEPENVDSGPKRPVQYRILQRLTISFQEQPYRYLVLCAKGRSLSSKKLHPPITRKGCALTPRVGARATTPSTDAGRAPATSAKPEPEHQAAIRLRSRRGRRAQGASGWQTQLWVVWVADGSGGRGAEDGCTSLLQNEQRLLLVVYGLFETAICNIPWSNMGSDVVSVGDITAKGQSHDVTASEG